MKADKFVRAKQSTTFLAELQTRTIAPSRVEAPAAVKEP